MKKDRASLHTLSASVEKNVLLEPAFLVSPELPCQSSLGHSFSIPRGMCHSHESKIITYFMNSVFMCIERLVRRYREIICNKCWAVDLRKREVSSRKKYVRSSAGNKIILVHAKHMLQPCNIHNGKNHVKCKILVVPTHSDRLNVSLQHSQPSWGLGP